MLKFVNFIHMFCCVTYSGILRDWSNVVISLVELLLRMRNIQCSSEGSEILIDGSRVSIDLQRQMPS